MMKVWSTEASIPCPWPAAPNFHREGYATDLNTPFVLKRGATVEELASRVHKDFLEKFKTARVWGSGVFDGQPVGRDYVLQDGDVVELRI
ncbi:MAG: TGS domain-containing protein [Chloroflexi bacterium]|nr:TGS domain-containing protein [Chloroflexota bacterium]